MPNHPRTRNRRVRFFRRAFGRGSSNRTLRAGRNQSYVPTVKKWYYPRVKTDSFQSAFFHEVADATQFLQALEYLPGSLFMIKNLDSRYIYMSRALKAAINLPPEHEVVGKTDFDLFPKIIAESFRQNDLLVF